MIRGLFASRTDTAAALAAAGIALGLTPFATASITTSL